MDKHLNSAEWFRFFTNEMDMAEEAHALRHISECPACSDFYTAARSLRRALREKARSSESASSYAAVAGIGQQEERAKIGTLTVAVIPGADGAVFCADALETTGIAEKYAINPDAEGRVLADDEDLLRMTLSGDKLEIRFEDRGVLYASFDDQRDGWIEVGQYASLPLPGKKGCALELMFLC